MSGVRADVRLVELGLAPSREKARTLIMAGEVFIDTLRIDKPGAAVPEDALLTVKEQAIPFVSRGGLKLDKAVRKYGLDFTDMVTMDVGASTGGFTDCMLQNGAKKVYAIDVGYGQLDWKLRNDPRVVVMERTNARNMEPDWFTEAPDFASMDVSFISVKLILPGIYKSLREGAQAVILVKPQFEAGRGRVGKNGVVRDKDTPSGGGGYRPFRPGHRVLYTSDRLFSHNRAEGEHRVPAVVGKKRHSRRYRGIGRHTAYCGYGAR